MAMSLLGRFAARAPVPVFPAVGRDGEVRLDVLSLAPALRVVDSPRHASILLVSGDIRTADRDSLARVHDQLAHPRATLWWGTHPRADTGAALTVAAAESPETALRDLYRRLLTGGHTSETHWLADEPPNPWRGRGDHGQGGEGMMGGVPYGRMMPMPPTPDLRDGLALDVYTAQFGPFLPQLPPGLVLEITLQGDVIQSAAVVRPPFLPGRDASAPFDRVLHEATPVAAIERARAAHHLRCVARLLGILQLAPQAARCRRTALKIERGGSIDLAPLRKTLRRAGAFAAIPAGLGPIDAAWAAELGGPAARAADQARDRRETAPAYRNLDFRTLCQSGGDVRARFTQWLDEAEQALALARAAGDAAIEKGAPVETLWGHRAPPSVYRLTDMLPGLEWGEALLTIASFDAAAVCRMAPLGIENP